MSRPSKRILLVEDNVDQLELCISALKEHDPDMEIKSAGDGSSALTLLGESPFDLVILDYSLPGSINGLEVLQQMNEMEMTVPVIMATGQGDERIAVQAMKAGVQDYLVKSRDYHDILIHAIEREITQCQLRWDLEEAHLRTRCLYDILLSVTKEQKLEVMSERLVKGVCKLLGVERCVVILINIEKNEAVFSKQYGFHVDAYRFQGPLDALGCLMDAYVGQNPVVVDEPQKHPLWHKTPWLHALMREMLSVPLAMKGEITGVLTVMNKVKERSFSTEDINLLSTVAVHGGVAFDNAKFLEKIEKQAITDSLTDLYNHLEFHKRIGEELERTRRYGKMFSLLMLDIDHFKLMNDTFGHPVGDGVLKETAKVIRKCIRTCDLAFRYGGEEFAVILPETGLKSAKLTAERIRKEIAWTPLDIPEDDCKRITISIGVSTYPQDADQREDLISAADQALYAAKRDGRDNVKLYSEVLKKVINKEPIALDEYLSDPEMKTLRDIASVVDAKSPYMAGHTEGVLRYAMFFAESLNLQDIEKKNLEFASLLHNIGTVSLPSKLLNKPGPLTPEERKVIHSHPGVAQLLIKQSEQFQQVLPAILYHHERYDGKGYPNGLKGEEIPYLARMLCIVDSYFAMISVRSYRPRMTKAEAIEELRQNAGSQFDPEMVKAFTALLESEDVSSIE